jgi:hypothetical protein
MVSIFIQLIVPAKKKIIQLIGLAYMRYRGTNLFPLRTMSYIKKIALEICMPIATSYLL